MPPYCLDTHLSQGHLLLRTYGISLRRLLRIVLLLAALCMSMLATTAQECGPITSGGSESFSASITNDTSGASLAWGSTVAPWTKIRFGAVATAFGECSIRGLVGSPASCVVAGRYEKTVTQVTLWADIATNGPLNGSYAVGHIYGVDANYQLVFRHVLDSSSSDSNGPTVFTAVIPGRYDFHLQAIYDQTPCQIGAGSSDIQTFTIFVGDGDDANLGPENSCPESVGKPVNVTNGNMWLQQTDYSVPGLGADMEIKRTYNSRMQRSGIFGYGWYTVFDESITQFGAHLLKVKLPDGKAIFFGSDGAGSSFKVQQGLDFQGQVVQNDDGSYTLTFKDKRVHQFNSSGKLVSMADRNGNTTTITYDANGVNPVSLADPSGRTLNLTYDAYGLVGSISDALGTVATYTHGFWGRLTAVDYPDGSGYRFTDAFQGNSILLTTVQDALNNVLEYHAYDLQGRAISSELQGGVEKYLLNFVNSTETDVTDALGRVRKYTFDTAKGRNVVTKTEGACACGGGGSQIQNWVYDDNLNLTSKTDALGHATSYTYDVGGNPLTDTDATGTVTYTYNSFGEVLTRTDQMNGVSTMTYDVRGNLLTKKDALNKTTTITPNTRGLITSITDPLNHATSFEYDTTGNFTRRTDALGNHTDFVYDLRGRLSSVTDALGQTTSYLYDALGRVSRVTKPDGSYVNNTYDLAGRKTGVSDARNTLDPTLAPTPAPSPTPTPVPAGNILISEFRLRGPNGPNDEFIELYNNTDAAVTVHSVDGSSGWSVAALSPIDNSVVTIFTVPTGTVLPPRGRFLGVNYNPDTSDTTPRYSLKNYGGSGQASGDIYYTADTPDGAGLALFETSNSSNFTLANRLDAAGFSGITDTLFRQGPGLSPSGGITTNIQHTFARYQGSGLPQSTNDNAADFQFLSTDGGTYDGRVSLLGASGPENLSSPTGHGATINSSLPDPTKAATVVPNRARDTRAFSWLNPFTNNTLSFPLGTLSIQRVFTNNTGRPVTKLRFRVVNMTTLGTSTLCGSCNYADLRIVGSSGTVTDSTGAVVYTATGLQLEQPAAQDLGGGYNSTVVVDLSSLPNGALAAGNTLSVQFLLGVIRGGNFAFIVTTDGIEDGQLPTPTPTPSPTPTPTPTPSPTPAPPISDTTYTYDSAYRLTSQTDALGHTTSYGYDLMSNLTSVTDQLGRVTNFEYDAFNHLVKTVYPAATAGASRLEETKEYDLVGKIIKQTDTAGRVTLYEHDAANRLIKVTDADLKVTEYAYNARSNATSVTDAINQQYTFTYDALGRQIGQTRAGVSMSYSYDDAGRRIRRTDYNGAVTNYAYDALNRLTGVTYPDTTSLSYGYDAESRLTSAANLVGTVSFSYDVIGRVSSTTDVWGKVVSYGYDADSNRTEMKLDSVLKANYDFDDANRLSKITDGAGAIVSYAYDATNKPTSKQLPNGVNSSYQYDDINRLKRLTDATASATVADFQYQYNTASQVSQQTDEAGTHNYGYDVVNRLISANHTSEPAESYAFDGVGNRTSSSESTSYTYAPFNRLTSTDSATFAYDDNGNTISKTPVSGSALTFAWDFENRMVTSTPSGASAVTYKYDALGRRVKRTEGANWTKFTYDGQDVILDQRSDGSTVEYLNGPGIDNKIRQTDSATGQALYFTQDHLGSTRRLTDSTGAMVESIDYDSFGYGGSSSYTRYLYTGREIDATTGLYFYRARWYDPEVGRFISEDPIGFTGNDIILYGYAKNDPLSFTDPTGYRRCNPLLGAFLGGAAGGIGGAAAGAVAGAVSGALLGGTLGSFALPGGGTIVGGAGAAIAGAGLGAYVGGAIGTGVGIGIGYNYCNGDDTAPKERAEPKTKCEPDRGPRDTCNRLLVLCLTNPWRRDWSRRTVKWGKLDCGACFRECVHDGGAWPFYKCPMGG